MEHEKSCGALIFHEDSEQDLLLLIKHRNGGHWSFPKGHVEGNETEVETALREIWEETGLQVDLVTDFRESVSYFPKDGVTKEVIYFLAHSETTTLHLQEEEVGQGIWVDIPKALTLVTYNNDRHLIEEAVAWRESHPGEV